MNGQERSWHVQGRDVTDSDLEWIRCYRQAHPEARRKRIAIALCEHWGWYNGRGHLKEMAARALLKRLADRGLVELPPLRQWIRRNEAVGRAAAPVPPAGEAIKGALSSLQPLSVRLVEDGDRHDRWAGYLRGYHYLGLSIVGEQYPIPDPALGQGSASGQSCARHDTAAHQCGLATEVRPWASVAGNLRGYGTVQRNMLSRRELAAGRGHPWSYAPGS